MEIREKQIADVKKAFDLFPFGLEIVAIHEQHDCETRRIDIRCLDCNVLNDTTQISVMCYPDGLEKSNHQTQLQVKKHIEKYHKN